MHCVKNTPDLGKLETITCHSSDWSKPKNQFEFINGNIIEYQRIVVFKCYIPYIDSFSDQLAIEYLAQWKKSEAGQWATAHSVEPLEQQLLHDIHLLNINTLVIARFQSKDATFWKLKWGDSIDR